MKKILKKVLKIFLSLQFAIGLLFIIAILSSIGSIIEQDETISFYQENYSSIRPLYGIIDFNFILFLGLDHIYRTWWFILLLLCLGFSLTGCTILRQFPLVKNSKKYFFKKENKSFQRLPFFVQVQSSYYIKEAFLTKLHTFKFSIYQKKNFLYAYKGLLGRISPILVHFSLLLILGSSTISSLYNFKSQEIIPKGEIFRIQNVIKVGALTKLPPINIRVNDFWIDYKKEKIAQFYSNISLLDNLSREISYQSISVNNPLKYKSVDFYQSDWNLIGIRVKKFSTSQIYEYPFFSLAKSEKKEKIWVTWIKTEKQNYTLLFNKVDNTFSLYNEKGEYLSKATINSIIDNTFLISDILPSTGLLIKYDPTVNFLYGGFGLLIVTTLISYLPYTQLWLQLQKNRKTKMLLIGCTTNRGKLGLELEFENILRYTEKEKIYLSRLNKN
jgi:cytochrome c biogenesis protein